MSSKPDYDSTPNKENEVMNNKAEEKENEDKLFKEYEATHQNSQNAPLSNEKEPLSENDISNEIDKEMNNDV